MQLLKDANAVLVSDFFFLFFFCFSPEPYVFAAVQSLMGLG